MARRYGDFIEVPALLGDGVNRYTGILVIQIIDGKPCDSEYGEEITIKHRSTLKGWGDLSGAFYALSNGADVAVKDWPWS